VNVVAAVAGRGCWLPQAARWRAGCSPSRRPESVSQPHRPKRGGRSQLGHASLHLHMPEGLLPAEYGPVKRMSLVCSVLPVMSKTTRPQTPCVARCFTQEGYITNSETTTATPTAMPSLPGGIADGGTGHAMHRQRTAGRPAAREHQERGSWLVRRERQEEKRGKI